MPRQPNHSGGGAQTNANGLRFEQTTDLKAALQNAGFRVDGDHVYKGNKEVGMSTPKHRIYSYLVELKIDYKDYNSKKWLPDEAFINFSNKTVYIIEKKFQNGAGSVDEKLPGCDFKKQEYIKLFGPLGYKVEYIYLFNDWFRQDVYRDVRDYIESVGCKYFFNEIPLKELGL